MIRRLIIGAVILTVSLLLVPRPLLAALPRVLPACDQTVYLVPVNCDPTGKVGTKCTEYTPEQYNDQFKTEKDKLQNPPKVTVEKACGFNDFVQLFVNLASWGLAILALFGTGFFVWGGFTLLTSAGNQEKIKEGKSTLWGAVLGIFIVLTAWIFVNFIVSALTGTGPILFARNAEFTRRFSGQGCPNYEACGRNDLRYNDETGKGCRDDARRNGNAVTDVQSKLRQLGCYDDAVDGCFGPRTKDAVNRFQYYNSSTLIPSESGAVDQRTREALDLAANRAGGFIGCVESPLTGEVLIETNRFTPEVVVVKANGTVTWKNTVNQIVIVTFQDQVKEGQSPPVKAIDVGDSASQTFPNPGTYRYSRGAITGRVIVSFF